MTALEYIKSINEKEGYGTGDDEILETLRESNIIYEKNNGMYRWWTEVFRVVDIGGRLVGFYDATSDGDESATERGWEFDANSVTDVEEITIKGYVPVKPK